MANIALIDVGNRRQVEFLYKGMKHLGHKLMTADELDQVDILFIDHDGPTQYRNIIDAAPHAKIALYMHGEPIMTHWDGVWEPHPRTQGFLSSNPGNKYIMEKYQYTKRNNIPIWVIGWYRGNIKKFKPRKKINSVLFAPIHPLAYYMNQTYADANRNAFGELVQLSRRHGFDLEVRYIGDLAMNGLWIEDDVFYHAGEGGGSLRSNAGNDVVVSNPSGTYFTISVQSGMPCVAFGQDFQLFDGWSDDDIRYARSWHEWKDYFRYPYDLAGGYRALEAAVREEAVDWRSKFCGKELDLDVLEQAINEILETEWREVYDGDDKGWDL